MAARPVKPLVADISFRVFSLPQDGHSGFDEWFKWMVSPLNPQSRHSIS
jgi:hypothetical protein